MNSLEALDRLRFDVSVAQSFDIDYIEANNEGDIIKKDLEILEEIKNYFKVIDWGEGFQYRYELIYLERYKFIINKKQYIKWSKWLNEK